MDTQPSLYEKNRLLIKGFLIGALILLMLIPASLIHNLVGERQSRQEQVVKEVSGKWAGAQTITGPVLLIPYNYISTDAKGGTTRIRKIVHFLPCKK